MIFFWTAIISTTVSYSLTFVVRKLATKYQLVDDPNIEPDRRQHKKPTALGGGIAIGITIILIAGFFWWTGDLTAQFIGDKQLLGFLLGALVLLIGGTLDDKYGLPVWIKIILPIFAAGIVVSAGVGVNFITNPMGGVIRLDATKLTLFNWQGVPYYLNVWADLFTVAWLTLLMYSTKLLDGLDGLVTGVTAIGAGVLFFLSLSAVVLQFDTALLAIIVSASFIGFLPHNWNLARIFLGDSGSLLAGYTLGVIAIIAGGKIATTALVLGLPVIDAIWVVAYRVFWLKKSPFSADRQHLHYRLLDTGFTVKQVVVMFYIISLAFGMYALFMETSGKVITFALLSIISFSAIGIINYVTTNKTN